MDLKSSINEYIQRHSNYDEHRNYLGISKISECPTRVYDEFLEGAPGSESIYRMCYAGYEQEKMILEMLSGIGFARILTNENKEVIAPFDDRLRGHIDAEDYVGNLLEIKSVNSVKFNKIVQAGRSLPNHYIQVQLYMRYGRWKSAWIVYRCRETYEHHFIYVNYYAKMADEYERKAKRILAAIDQKIRPECECGRCK